MCLITIKGQGIDLPKDEYLENGERINKEGIGCAYWKKGSNEVIIKKDFKNIKKFIEWEHESITKEDSLLIHFRLATSGWKDEGNRHPFPLTNSGELLRKTNLSCESALVHNGVFSDFSGHKKFSDTQKFIMDVISDNAVKSNLNSPAIRRLILEFIGRDRLAVLMNNGEIYIFGEYEKEDGLLFSNTSYKRYTERCVGYGSWNQGNYLNNYQRSQLPRVYQKDNDEEEYLQDLKEGHKAECHGCHKRNFVRYFATEGEENYLFLCKKCRKAARKSRLQIKGETIIPEGSAINSSVGEQFDKRCDACSVWVKSNEVNVYEDTELCDDCFRTFSQIQ